MAFQTVFKRYEQKYLLTTKQKEKIIDIIRPHMKPDKYGRSTVRNLYFDTDSYLLNRLSIEKPEYKEKLRVRCYSKADPDTTVFVELKKKYRSVVYKRRISMPESEAMEWLMRKNHCHKHTQISDEVDYFLDFYESLHPTVFLTYEREAYYSCDGSDLRITFDSNILCREEDLSLCSDIYGTPILQSGTVLMEIKCSGGIPLCLTHVLSKECIYKTSFSKYGTAYRNIILPRISSSEKHNTKEDTLHV